MLDDLKFIHNHDGSDLLNGGEWAATVPTKQNLAKRIALDIIGKSAVIYGDSVLAHSWKTDFNTLARHVAWCGQLSDNESAGWRAPTDKLYAIIELRSALDSTDITAHYEQNERLLSGQRPAPIIVNLQGETAAEQHMWGMSLGHAVAAYLALLNGVKL